MNWFGQNRFLGTFLAVFGLVALGALYFFWSARSSFDEARARFNANAAELNRLDHLAPFPKEANLAAMKSQANDYGAQLEKLKEDLKTHVLPVTPMAPNEFQAQLRRAVTAVSERARLSRVKLPDRFFLGFEEFASALPDNAAAPVLGQQLAQVELLMNIMIDARVESVTSLRRLPRPETSPGPTPAKEAASSAKGRKPPAASASGPHLLDRTVIETAFVANPGATRRVLNQIASVNQQFYVTRTLQILNEKDKGPEREVGTAAAGTATSAAGTKAPPANTALNFIVGTERLTVSAQIEMVRFTF